MNKFIVLFFISLLTFFCCEIAPVSSKKQFRSYFPNGKLESIVTYDAATNKKCGRFFYPNGILKKELCNLNDKKTDTMKVYYSNGILESKMYYDSGKVNGRAFWYHPNGKIRETVIFKNDKSEGILLAYLPSGKLSFINYFHDGFLHYVKFYRRDSTEKITGFTENYIPKISLNSDTINYGDTLNVNFELHLPMDSVNCKNIFILYDFSPGEYNENIELIYPSNKLRMDSTFDERKFIIKDTGSHFLYGLVYTNKEGEEKYYKQIIKPFYVKKPH